MKYIFSLYSVPKNLQSILPLLFALLSFASSANEFSFGNTKGLTCPETISQKVLVQSPADFDGDNPELNAIVLWSSNYAVVEKNVTQKISCLTSHFSSVIPQGFLARAPPILDL